MNILSTLSQNKFLTLLTFENITDLTVILSALFIAIQARHAAINTKLSAESTKIAMNSLELAHKSYKFSAELETRNKAINLSEYYRTEILPDISYLSQIFNHLKLENDLSKIDHFKLKTFSKKELNKLYEKNLIKKIIAPNPEINWKEVCHLSPYFKSLSMPDQLKIIKNLNTDFNSELKRINKIMSKDKEKMTYDLGVHYNNLADGHNEQGLILNKFSLEYQRIKNDLTNKLEYFSMSFVNGTADEKVVYQSLHQSYIAAVIMIYPLLSHMNEEASSSYYCNVKTLYTHWSTLNKEACDQESHMQESITLQNTKIAL